MDETVWDHQGALAAEFADGALGWEYPGPQVLVRRVGGRTLPRDEGFLRPASGIVGWRQFCVCGHPFHPWIRAGDPGRQDVAARHVYSPHPSPPMDVIGDLSGREWAAHLPAGV